MACVKLWTDRIIIFHLWAMVILWDLDQKPITMCEMSMMTSYSGNIFCVIGHLCGEFTGPGEFTAQRPVMRSFDVFFDLRLNKRLSKQSWGWWFETLPCPLWHHCNVAPCCQAVPELMLTYHQWYFVGFIWWPFPRECTRQYLQKCA